MKRMRQFIGRLLGESLPSVETPDVDQERASCAKQACREAVQLQYELQQRLPPGTRVHVQVVATVAPGVVRVTGSSGPLRASQGTLHDGG